MATYLQGVTDYIPEFQPFQPDLNFYSNVMQTKQSQYDSNWKALNKMYGQYFYADLTRDNNIKKKDELLKNMEFNLKRVSQLDLSLEQNVNQATQIFKPFYEDKGLMKDMAWTKTYNAQVGKAQALQGSAEEDRRKQFWDTGLRELQYKRDEFKAADDATAMSFGNVAYTPYVNSVELAQKIAKDAGLSIETPDFSPDGKWIITTKNGEKLREPLSKLFEARLGSDPQVQAVYKTQAYVNRKDYAYSNAAQFDGDKDKAEMKYLENSFNILKEQNKKRYESVKERSKSYDDKIKQIEKSIADKTAAPTAQKTLKEYQEAKEINDKILERVEKENNEFNKTSSSTPSTSTGFINPYGDVNSLRWKVDAGMANMLMSKDLNEAAEIFAYKDYKVNIKENPYKVLDIKHSQAMQQIHTRGSYTTRAASIRAQGAITAAKIRNAGEMETLKMSEGIKKGYIKPEPVIDPTTGQIAIDPNTNTPIIKFVQNDNDFFAWQSKTGSTGEINPTDMLNNMQQLKTKQFQSANAQLAQFLKVAQDKGAISAEEVDDILNPGDLHRKTGPSKYDKVLEAPDPNAPVGRKDDFIDFDPQSRALKTKRVTLDNLSSLSAKDMYNLEKTFIPQQSKLFSQEPGAKEYVDKRNYYAAVMDRLDSYINDNYDIPYITSAGPKIKDVLLNGKLEAYVNHDIEDWKYNVRQQMAKEVPFGDQLFDEDNNLLSKEAISQIAAKAVYGEYEKGTQSKQGFFESVGNTLGYYLGGKDLDPETMKYWKSWADSITGQNNAPSTWIGEKYAKYKGYFQGPGSLVRTGEVDKDFLYVNLKDKLEEAHDKIFKNATSSDWYKENNLANMPTFNILNEGGTGFAAVGTGVQVLPQAPGTKGFQSWHGFVNDYHKIASFDGKENAILFGNTEGISGTDKTALDNVDNAVKQTRISQTIIQALIAASSHPDNDLKPFTIVGQNIAAGDYNKGAMTIMPDAEWLKQFKSTNEDGDNNLLNNDQYNAIIQNGLSVISNISNFNNPLMQSTFKSPLESIVDYRKSYEEAVPGGGTFRIDKGTPGLSDYITTTTLESYDPNTNETLKGTVYDSFLPKQGQLELARQNQIEILKLQREDNVRANNGYYSGY